jgi:hypothetical protein
VRGYVRVNWAAEKSTVALAAENLGDELQPEHDQSAPELPAPGEDLGEPISSEVLLTYVDFLERSLPFVNVKGIHTYVNRKMPGAAAHSIDTLLDGWNKDGTLQEYVTELMCTNDSGVAVQVPAVRLNRARQGVREALSRAYEQRSDSWVHLPAVKRIVFLTTLVVLADEQPYFHWHTVRTRLSGGGDTTDWDTVFVTALNAGVIQSSLTTIPHHRTGTDFTLQRIILNTNHADVRALL